MSVFASDVISDSISELKGISTIIEAMGGDSALELDDEGRQQAMYHLADTIMHIYSRLEAAYEDLKDDDKNENDHETRSSKEPAAMAV